MSATSFKLVITCDGCKVQQHVELHGVTREMAVDFAAMLDGTSAFFVKPVPRGKEAPTLIGKCELCGDSFRAIVQDRPEAGQVA